MSGLRWVWKAEGKCFKREITVSTAAKSYSIIITTANLGFANFSFHALHPIPGTISLSSIDPASSTVLLAPWTTMDLLKVIVAIVVFKI